MACLLKLVRLTDFSADIDEIDLMSGGYTLADNGYMPAAAPIGAASVYETITLNITGSGKDDLADKIQAIDEKIKQVQWWIDNLTVERYQVWLRVQLDNESLPRQAQIISIQPPDQVQVFNPAERNANYIGSYTLGIERTSYWEDPYPYPSTTSKTGINSIGGIVQLSETINGDVPARLAQFSLAPHGSSSYYQGDYFAGFKTDRYTNPANYVSVWSLKDGTMDSADTTTSAESSAYSGTMCVCTFATSAALTQRIGMILSDVTANYSDQRGTAQVLLRARMTSSGTARVRIAYSFALRSGGTTTMYGKNYRSRTVISGTSWRLYEMGTISIPPSRLEITYDIRNFGIILEAERITGSDSLQIDCLVLIPTDEGFIHMQIQGNSVTDTDHVKFYQYADDRVNAISDLGGLYTYFPATATTQNFSGLPANNYAPYVVVAGQLNNDPTFISTKGQNVQLSYTYIPRWRTLRGNVT